MPLSLLNYSEFWADPAGAPTLLASALPGFDIVDENGLVSEPQSPVAIPGEGRTASSPVTLNASASLLTDTFSWKLVSTPDGSTATIDPTNGSITTLTADTDGEYVTELTASNAAGLSSTKQTTITIDSTLNVSIRRTHLNTTSNQ